jgi:2'-5' RNA ligase
LALSTQTPPEIEFGEITHGDAFFKFIFLRIKKSESLLALASLAREKLVPGANEVDGRIYDPHISLVYSAEEATEERVEYVAWETRMAIGESRGWTGGKVVLVDTRTPNVEDWRIVEEYVFPESS